MRFALDMIVLTLVVVSIVLGKQKEFVRDWALPIALFYLYEFLRGRGYVIATYFDRQLIDSLLIDIERVLFTMGGEIPTVFLQYALSNPLAEIFVPSWYDFVLFIFYTSFFWFWLLVGFFLWFKKKDLFKPYMYGLVAFSLFDTLIYILYPSAPPWYASEVGLLPELNRVMLSYDFLSAKYVTLVSTYGNNNFAAFPSHHAAWPFFSCLFLVRAFGKRFIPVFIIPLVIAFATWYGAEHYIIDSLAGFFVAYVTYLIFTGDIKRWFNILFDRGRSKELLTHE